MGNFSWTRDIPTPVYRLHCCPLCTDGTHYLFYYYFTEETVSIIVCAVMCSCVCVCGLILRIKNGIFLAVRSGVSFAVTASLVDSIQESPQAQKGAEETGKGRRSRNTKHRMYPKLKEIHSDTYLEGWFQLNFQNALFSSHKPLC